MEKRGTGAMKQRATGSFLVRLWLEDGGPAPLTGARRKRLRGQVRDLKTGETTLVADLQALGEVLMESLQSESMPDFLLARPAEELKSTKLVATSRR